MRWGALRNRGTHVEGVYVLVKLSNSSLASTIEKDTSSTDREVYAGANNIWKVRSGKNYQGFGLVLGSTIRGEMGKRSETQQLGMREPGLLTIKISVDFWKWISHKSIAMPVVQLNKSQTSCFPVKIFERASLMDSLMTSATSVKLAQLLLNPKNLSLWSSKVGRLRHIS